MTLARELIAGETAWDKTEKLHIDRWPRKDLLTAIREGKVTDLLSVSAILLYLAEFPD